MSITAVVTLLRVMPATSILAYLPTCAYMLVLLIFPHFFISLSLKNHYASVCDSVFVLLNAWCVCGCCCVVLWLACVVKYQCEGKVERSL